MVTFVGYVQMLDVASDLVGLTAEDWLQWYTLEATLSRSTRTGDFLAGVELPKLDPEGEANTAYFRAITNR